MTNTNNQILEGSRAIALTIKKIRPGVISAYPITPQTHIVEDLSQFKADGEVDYEYVRAESEFAAASIVEGASATGVRVYTATSSQGLLLMTEVLYNIAGMRLPVVLTCANRGVSAPITIWNDHQDSVTMRDAGWIQFYAENHQEAVEQHIIAYKVAEQLGLPAMVNIDGFVLTHSYESVRIPSEADIKKFLPDYKPKKNGYLDPANPKTMGAFATPAHYMEIRQALHDDMVDALKVIIGEYQAYREIISDSAPFSTSKQLMDNGLLEYHGPKKAKTIIIALGSVAGTIKEAFERSNNVGVLKLKVMRPFPEQHVLDIIEQVKPQNIAVIEKAISLGAEGPLAMDIKTALYGKTKAKVQSFIAGLGGRDITKSMIKKIARDIEKEDDEVKFVGSVN
ncbi:pyruvate ferredoxin oxidoreductase [Candidatus Falkowbacteria bacterium]|nr:pyruvate ferredoxin oxidoreductase [Candidatus Falkowbacteria bacterium]